MFDAKEYRIRIPSTYLEKDDVWRIINAVPFVSRHTERDQLLLKAMWETGGRVSEVVQLIHGRIIEDESAIVLANLKQEQNKPREERKDHWKKTYISQALTQELLNYCKKHRIGESDWVFEANIRSNQHLSRNYVWWIINKAAGRAGVLKFSDRHKMRRPAWPHLFRHACAMFILEKTGKTEKVQRQLGHASIVTTQSYAILKLQETDREISDLEWEEK